MIIPPEILEQIEKASTVFALTKMPEPPFELSQKSFKHGAKYALGLLQKQTPPPTGKSIFILNMLHANNEGRVIGFECNQRAQKSVDKQPKVILGFNEYREVTDRDQKIAQAVEGLVQTMRDYREEFEDCTCDNPEVEHESKLCHAYFAFDLALSKYEEAKK